MKAIILLILSCASLMAADTNVQVSLSFSTNLNKPDAAFTTGEEFITATSVSSNRETGEVLTTETFIDADVSDYGQTNLVRITASKRGAVVFRSHEFYHEGKPVASLTFLEGVQSFHTLPGPSCHVDMEFSPSKEIGPVEITSEGEDSTRDIFYPRSGVFYPVHFPRQTLYLQ